MLSRADRLRGAVWGQFVGDAACLGSHWIYDPAEIERRWPGGLSGLEAPTAGHYHARRRPGELTHYGDAALILLESVVERRGFDAVDFGRRFMEALGAPEYPGYLDKAMKGTFARYSAFRDSEPDAPFDFQQGADDFEPATVTRLAPVVAAHSADDRFLRIVESATRVSQDNARAVAYALHHALALRELLRGRSIEEAFDLAGAALPPVPFSDEVGDRMALARSMVGVSGVTAATSELGQHCRLDQSVPSAAHSALTHRTDLRAAVLSAARAGGDSAGRAAMIGAWLGAALGIEAVPLEWRERLEAHGRIHRLVERLIAFARP